MEETIFSWNSLSLCRRSRIRTTLVNPHSPAECKDFFCGEPYLSYPSCQAK
jgi:hypothetical protein